jgi:hypothetical protein
LIVDDYTRMKWSLFCKTKCQLTSIVLPFLTELQSKGSKTRFIRMDNAGENLVLASEVRKLCIEVEFTAPNTPQHNGVVERAIATIASRSRAMMNGANINMALKRKLWAECFNTATDLSNVLPRRDKAGKSSYELFYGEKVPKWYQYLKPFGLIGYATNKN